MKNYINLICLYLMSKNEIKYFEYRIVHKKWICGIFYCIIFKWAFKENIRAISFYEKHGYVKDKEEYLGKPYLAYGIRFNKKIDKLKNVQYDNRNMILLCNTWIK